MIDGDRALWSAVLDRVFEDATSQTQAEEGWLTCYDASEARRYLTTQSEDLQLVCDLAGVPMDSVRRRAMALQAQGWTTAQERIAA